MEYYVPIENIYKTNCMEKHHRVGGGRWGGGSKGIKS